MRFFIWSKENFHIVLLVMVVAGFGGFVGYRSYQRSTVERVARVEKERVQKVRADLGRRQAWAEIPVDKPELEGHPPPIPEMPTADQPDWFKERLRILIQHHPDESIHTVMDEAVKSGRLLLNSQTGTGNIAEFKVVKRSDIVEAEVEMDARELVPVFAFDPNQLASLKGAQEIREAMLVVYHEHLHYRQWLTQSKGAFTTYGEPVTPANAAKACEFMWVIERDAYEDECRVAVEWGMGSFMGGLCEKVSNPSAFSQYLFWIMSRPSNRPAKYCRADWARLAGHPDPDAFL